MATTKREAESGILALVHKAAAGLHKAGLVDKATMREFDALCLTPVESPTPEEIRALREEREQVSQPVFAHYLNAGRTPSANGSGVKSGRMGRRSNCSTW
jgi:putative transcriptional regulator